MKKLCHCAAVPACSLWAVGRNRVAIRNLDASGSKLVYLRLVCKGRRIAAWSRAAPCTSDAPRESSAEDFACWGRFRCDRSANFWFEINFWRFLKTIFVSHLKAVCRLRRRKHSVLLEKLHHQLSSLLQNLPMAFLVGIVGHGPLRRCFWCSWRSIRAILSGQHCVDANCKKKNF